MISSWIALLDGSWRTRIKNREIGKEAIR